MILFISCSVPYDQESAPGEGDEALAYHMKYCVRNIAQACLESGYIHRKKGDNQSIEQSLISFQKACDLNNSVGCKELADWYANGSDVTADIAKANAYFQKACELGEANSCNRLGESYKNGFGLIVDMAKASEFFQKACSNESCSRRCFESSCCSGTLYSV